MPRPGGVRRHPGWVLPARRAVVLGVAAAYVLASIPAIATPKGPSRRATAPEVSPALAIAVSPPAFSPNGDGRLDEATISLVVEPPELVDVAILSEDGRLHRRLTAATTGDIGWDGRSDAGTVVPDGPYLVEAVSVGHPEPVTAAIRVDTMAPRAGIRRIGPDPYDGRGAVRIRLRTRDVADLVGLSVSVRDRVGEVFRARTESPAGRSTLRIRPRYANGGPLYPGRYLMGFTVADDAGNESVSRRRPWRVHRAMPGKVIRRVEGAGPRVALTFDDCHVREGWSRILTVLRRQGAGATFFCPGRVVAANPDLARRTVAGGHMIGSHGWDHGSLGTMSFDGVADRLRRDARTMWRVARETTAPYTRPPDGRLSRTLVAAAGATSHPRVIMWDVDPQDWRRLPPSAIVSSVVGGARSGSIVVLHTLTGTAGALPQIISGLRGRGLEPVGLPELFRAAGFH